MSEPSTLYRSAGSHGITTILVGMGVVTALFQWGWGTGLLRVGSGAPLIYLIPVLVVGIMFGLSTDRQVFLVSRMHEEWTHTCDNARAVRVGVAETGRVITAAATIMFCVFASFALTSERIVAMIGIGLAVAVLVDAFVVRLTLIPALMPFIGDPNAPLTATMTPHLSVEDDPADDDDPGQLPLETEAHDLVAGTAGASTGPTRP